MRRTKAEAAETRASILAAAEQLFFEKGVANSSLDEIATAAGVTRGAIYWHFENKSDLFLELYNAAQLPRVNMVEVADLNCDERNALAAVEKAACEWLETLAADIHRQRLISILLRTNFTEESQPVLDALKGLEDEHETHIQRVLAKAARNGRLAPEWTPQSASRAVKWLIKGVCWEWLLFGQTFDLVKEGCESVRRLFSSFRIQVQS